MQVRQTLGKGAHIGKGSGKRLQGRLYPIFVKAKLDRFGLGYHPNRQGRKEAMRKNQEKRKAMLIGEDLPWGKMVFLPLHQVFTSGGLLDPTKTREENDPFDHNLGNFKIFSGTIDGKNNRLSNLTDDDLSAHFESLTVNPLIDDERENPYLEQICPCSPELELNNWTAEELLIIFKSNTE
ncbi:hypothetical protein V6N13_142512 [Hibiscus sabdariffa]|uniref:Uncharacterized protein n=1 Tax=Hibiscus sabdariffa TaxID=183260 RepID=A0ABR2FEE7_9ROSI